MVRVHKRETDETLPTESVTGLVGGPLLPSPGLVVQLR